MFWHLNTKQQHPSIFSWDENWYFSDCVWIDHGKPALYIPWGIRIFSTKINISVNNNVSNTKTALDQRLQLAELDFCRRKKRWDSPTVKTATENRGSQKIPEIEGLLREPAKNNTPLRPNELNDWLIDWLIDW